MGPPSVVLVGFKKTAEASLLKRARGRSWQEVLSATRPARPRMLCREPGSLGSPVGGPSAARSAVRGRPAREKEPRRLGAVSCKAVNRTLNGNHSTQSVSFPSHLPPITGVVILAPDCSHTSGVVSSIPTALLAPPSEGGAAERVTIPPRATIAKESNHANQDEKQPVWPRSVQTLLCTPSTTASKHSP